jgi:hypothetical protein
VIESRWITCGTTRQKRNGFGFLVGKPQEYSTLGDLGAEGTKVNQMGKNGLYVPGSGQWWVVLKEVANLWVP